MAGEKSPDVAQVKFHELGFQEFVELARPSASVNRLVGFNGADTLIYEVFMNGAIGKALGADLERQQFQGAMLHKIVEEVGLDPLSFRDATKVAELVALRHAWQTAIGLGVNVAKVVSGEEVEPAAIVKTDWPSVANFSHPFIKSVLKDHRALVAQLRPVLRTASMVLGSPVKEIAAQAVNTGTIVAQNGAHTIMDTGGGVVVAHNNKQLDTLPRVGDAVVIAYYRGQGQVFGNKEVAISAPYLHKTHEDLAIDITDQDSGQKRVFLFNGISSFAHFAAAHKLDRGVVESAIDLLAEKSAQMKARAHREAILPVGIDAATGAISLAYRERGVIYTALFPSEEQLRERAADFDLSSDAPELRLPSNLLPLDRSGPQAMAAALEVSEKNVRTALATDGRSYSEVLSPNVENGGPFSGPIIAMSDFHVAQDVGKGRAMIHSKFDLDRIPDSGHRMSVKYEHGRGRVDSRPLGQNKAHGHGR